MPLHYPPIRLGQQPSNHHGSSSGGLYYHQSSSASLLSREDSSIDICITGEKSHFVKQSGKSNSQTPRLGLHNNNIRNIASPIPHPINASSFNATTSHHQTMNNSASINTNSNNNNNPLDPNLSSILKEHLDESLIDFLHQNPQLIDSSAISLLNLVNKHASNNQQQVQPQTSLPEHTSHSQHQGIPNLSVNSVNNNETDKNASSSEPKITIIREYKQHTKPTTKTKKKPKYVPPTMDKAVRKKEDRLCALVVPNKQSVEFPDEFEFNEKHKSFVYNPEPTKSSFLERLSFLDSKKSKDRSLNYSVPNQKEGNSIELFSNNDISYYNKSDFLLASEKFVKTEKERSVNGSIPQWNKITDNIPMGFIDDLNADYIIQPVDRSSSVVPEEVEEPLERETFFITGLDETNNTNNSTLSKTQKSNTQKSEIPELPSRISTPNYVLFSRDGTNLSQMSQHSQRSVSPNVSVNLSRPHSTLSYHSVPSNNYLSNHSLIYQENAPPRPNTSMNTDRTAVLSAKKKWNVFPPRQRIIVNNPNKPINSFVSEQSMNLSQSSSSRMDFSRSATPVSSTFRTKSSISSRSNGYSVNSSQSHDSSEQEEIVIRLPDQCLISATSKPIISKPPPLKPHSIFNKSQDRTSTSHSHRDLLNASPINNH